MTDDPATWRPVVNGSPNGHLVSKTQDCLLEHRSARRRIIQSSQGEVVLIFTLYKIWYKKCAARATRTHKSGRRCSTRTEVPGVSVEIFDFHSLLLQLPKQKKKKTRGTSANSDEML